MITDLSVFGTSIASGVGRGPDKTPAAGTVKSWVQHLGDMCHSRNVWNHSLPGKPLGLVNADAVEFTKQYYNKYRTYSSLFVLLEYSLPSYKHWDPVASARSDCVQMNIVPVTYFKPMKSVEEAAGKTLYHGDTFLETQFYRREPVDMLNHSMHPHGIYHSVEEDDIVPEDLQQFEEEALAWFRPTEENRLRYLKYAFDEILAAQQYCEGLNIPYMQTWVGGVTDSYKRGVDRFMKPLMGNKRLVPMTEFTAATATMEWSDKPWRNHPDAKGHKRIAEFYYTWIMENKLYEGPNNTLYRGFSDV